MYCYIIVIIFITTVAWRCKNSISIFMNCKSLYYMTVLSFAKIDDEWNFYEDNNFVSFSY